MFLDDKLLQMCLEYEGTTREEVTELYANLCEKCQDYYKERIKVNMKKSEVKALFNKTFKLWDLFVEMTLKHPDKKVQILGKLFLQHTFKIAFMEDITLSKLYNEL